MNEQTGRPAGVLAWLRIRLLRMLGATANTPREAELERQLSAALKDRDEWRDLATEQSATNAKVLKEQADAILRLETSNRKLEAEIEVRNAECQALTEVIERDRRRVAAETAGYIARAAEAEVPLEVKK